MKLTPGPDESLDRLSHTLQILQRRRGHRATSDDVLLAGVGAEMAPDARRCLDLGTGKATVAMLLARRLPTAHLVAVEAEPVSVDLAHRNVALNGLTEQITVVGSDLRDLDNLTPHRPPEGFELITGAPPFMPLGTGVMPQDRQRAVGRFEIRGGVEGYADTAAQMLAPAGVVVILMDGPQGPRAEAAFEAAGLHPRAILEISPRPGQPPTYTVVSGGLTPGDRRRDQVSMRGAEGQGWSPWYAALRGRLALDGPPR